MAAAWSTVEKSSSRRQRSTNYGSHMSDNSGNISDAHYFRVEFKHARCDTFIGFDRTQFNVSDLVKVEADRGEDLGKLLKIMSSETFHSLPVSEGGSGGNTTKSYKRILRRATTSELEQIPRKCAEEEQALQLARQKAAGRNLPMDIIEAEYQFDRHKLTFFFEASRRIDFRELVRDLFAIYKTRIWMQQLTPPPQDHVPNALDHGRI